MKNNIKSLQLRLIISYVCIILFSFGFAAYFLARNLGDNALREIKSSLLNQANLVESQVPADYVKSENIQALNKIVTELSKKINARITIITQTGRVLADSQNDDIKAMDNHLSRPEIQSALRGETGEATRYSSTLKIDMLYMALPIKYNNENIGVVRLALALTYVQKELLLVRKAIIASFIFAILLALVLGSVMAAGIVKPLKKIIYSARRFAKGDFTHKILLDSTDEVGELAFALNSMANDIENKVKEIQIRNQHLAAILQSMIEGIIVVDRAGNILSINTPIERMFGIRDEDARNKLLLEAISNNDISDIVSDVLKSGVFKSREISSIWPKHMIFRIDVSPIFQSGGITGALVVIHDITEFRRLEAVRRDFVANVSHELKTPLTSIKGFVETLLEGAIDDKDNARHFLQIIEEHANRLNSLINDLLDLSSIESGYSKLQRENINIRDLTDRAILGFSSQLKNKMIHVDSQISPSFAVSADKDKLNQVFTNLIDNAIKFNKERGFIKIYADDLGDRLKIIIEDSGSGIPSQDIPRIFERFYRVDKARSRELGGTGLGLSIVKHIVELHGGSVGVESSEGFGSKFWFILPKS